MNAKVIRQAYSKTIIHDADADKEDKRGTESSLLSYHLRLSGSYRNILKLFLMGSKLVRENV